MQTVSCLPTELVSDILALALSQHPIPSAILRVNKLFFHICEPILYSNIHFTSTHNLSRFVQQRTRRPPIGAFPSPRTLSIALAGGIADFYVFGHLRDVLRCFSTWSDHHHDQQVSLDALSLCLNSHLRNPKLDLVYQALSLAKYVRLKSSFTPNSRSTIVDTFPPCTHQSSQIHLVRARSLASFQYRSKQTNPMTLY
jgi:hypothetical protein